MLIYPSRAPPAARPPQRAHLPILLRPEEKIEVDAAAGICWLPDWFAGVWGPAVDPPGPFIRLSTVMMVLPAVVRNELRLLTTFSNLVVVVGPVAVDPPCCSATDLFNRSRALKLELDSWVTFITVWFCLRQRPLPVGQVHLRPASRTG